MAKRLSFFFILIAVFICTGIVAFSQPKVISYRYIYIGTEKIYIVTTEDGEYPLIKTDENEGKVDYPIEEEYAPGKVDYPVEEEYAPGKVDYPIEEEYAPGKVDYPVEEEYVPRKVDYPVTTDDESESIVEEDINLQEEEKAVEEELEEIQEDEVEQKIVEDLLLNEEFEVQTEEKKQQTEETKTEEVEKTLIKEEKNEPENINEQKAVKTQGQTTPINEQEIEEVNEEQKIEEETETETEIEIETKLEEDKSIIEAEESNEEKIIHENTLEILVKDKKTENTDQFLVTITNPVESEFTFSSSFVLSGVANEGIEGITVELYILDEETNTFIPYKNTDGENKWDIGKSGIFIKEVILPNVGINEIRIVAYKKTEVENVELNVNLQVNDFSINLLDDSIKDMFNQEI